jgi:hypothetical protein
VVMKKKVNTSTREITFTRMALYGLCTEIVLIGLQFAFIRIYSGESKFIFDDNYMRFGGFYIFQVIGFFFYVILAYLLSAQIQRNLISKIAIFVITGCLVEYTFYFTIQAEWQGVFSYSVLSKLIAGAFGIVISLYSSGKTEHTTSKS